jgi:uroporphyrinogen-III synthase
MRVLVTRAEPEAAATAARLKALGHEAIVAPLTEIVLDTALPLPLGGVQALAVTSLNGIRALAGRADAAALRPLPLFAVGAATARAAEAAGFDSVFEAGGDAAALASALRARLDPAGGAVIWAAGRDRKDQLGASLGEAGFELRVAEVYRAEPSESLPAGIAADLAAGGIDAVMVFSERSAALLIRALADLPKGFASAHVSWHAISTAAARPLRQAELRPIVIASAPTAESLYATLGRAGGDGARPDQGAAQEP